jgi:hypothetical protein
MCVLLSRQAGTRVKLAFLSFDVDMRLAPEARLTCLSHIDPSHFLEFAAKKELRLLSFLALLSPGTSENASILHPSVASRGLWQRSIHSNRPIIVDNSTSHVLTFFVIGVVKGLLHVSFGTVNLTGYTPHTMFQPVRIGIDKRCLSAIVLVAGNLHPL